MTEKDVYGKRVLATTASLIFLLSACGGNDKEAMQPGEADATESSEVDSGGTSDEDVLVIDGSEYTCGQIVGAESCGELTQQVFKDYKHNLLGFVNSGSLGPLNEGSFEDAAFAGLVACAYADQGEGAYIDFMLSDPAFEGLERITFLPSWFEAQKSLCPDIAFASDTDGRVYGDDQVNP